MHPIVGKVIVNFVLLLISFIAYSSQIFVIWPWYGREVSVELLVLLVPFNILVLLLLYNYFLCVYSDPGGVPDSWKPDTHSDGLEVKKLTGRPRYCRMCQCYKPPRTHHCRQCNRCILRMDHHCPWINNCVGHFNYPHFLRFLFYVDLACSYHFMMMLRRVYENMTVAYWDTIPGLEFIFILLNFITCIPVLLAVGAFSLYHFLSLSRNTTTIEGWEKDKVATMVRRGKIRDVKFPYDLGWRRNVESVLGGNAWMWCWPGSAPGTGLRYELNTRREDEYDRGRGGGDDEEEYPATWPPEDPSLAHLTQPSHSSSYRDQAHPDSARAFYPTYDPEEDPAHPSLHDGFTLPESPWTLAEGGVNPALRASNSRLRDMENSLERGARRRRRGGGGAGGGNSNSRSTGYSTLPPYHPDYEGSADEDSDDSDSGSEEGYGHLDQRALAQHTQQQNPRAPLARRGSEGYEVRPMDREEVLRRYLQDEMQMQGDSESNSNSQYTRPAGEAQGELGSKSAGGGGRGAGGGIDFGELNGEGERRMDRYRRYVPEPDSEEEGDSEEDNVPLGMGLGVGVGVRARARVSVGGVRS